MPRSAAISIENQFNRGLITEATGLQFPENAVTESYDCIFNKTGTVQRRLGFDYEENYALSTIDVAGKQIKEFEWSSVAGLGSLTFVVLQVGSILHFYELTNEGALSSNKKGFTVDLSTYAVSGAPSLEDIQCSFTSGNGHLIVTHPYCESFYVSYDVDNDAITTNQITIYIRDFKGLNDGLKTDERPTTLSTEHKYNLYNQGWYASAPSGSSETTKNVLTHWDSRKTDFPSNADIWWIYKGIDEDSNRETFDANDQGFDFKALGNTPAPKGHYILKAFYQDRSAESGVPGVSVVSSSYFRPSCTAFFAGRTFFAGVNYQGFNNRIYFSGIIEDDNKFGDCYQVNDPTSEEVPDLLPSDGGVLVIPEIANIVYLHVVQNYLIVFATNGIWTISGSDNSGFKATDYTVRKIDKISTDASNSFVDVVGIPVWWTSSGIYTIKFDPTLGNITVESLTDNTIKEFFDDIPNENKQYAKGAYNSLTRIIQWVYRSTEASDITERHQYDRVLNLNLITGAFYPWTVGEIASGPYIAGIIAIQGSGTLRDSGNIVDEDGNNVIDGSSNQVIVNNITVTNLASTFKYLTVVDDDITWSSEKDGGYVDWLTFNGDGTEYDSYFITGFKVHGEAMKFFQSNIIHLFMQAEDNSSIYVTGIWDYATSGNTGLFSNQHQGYRTQANRSILYNRLRIRGRGIALQLKFESDGVKPFTVVGWAAWETGNASP